MENPIGKAQFSSPAKVGSVTVRKKYSVNSLAHTELIRPFPVIYLLGLP